MKDGQPATLSPSYRPCASQRRMSTKIESQAYPTFSTRCLSKGHYATRRPRLRHGQPGTRKPTRSASAATAVYKSTAPDGNSKFPMQERPPKSSTMFRYDLTLTESKSSPCPELPGPNVSAPSAQTVVFRLGTPFNFARATKYSRTEGVHALYVAGQHQRHRLDTQKAETQPGSNTPIALHKGSSLPSV